VSPGIHRIECPYCGFRHKVEFWPFRERGENDPVECNCQKCGSGFFVSYQLVPVFDVKKKNGPKGEE